ncbi:class I SAM-dependent methyltransferase [Actinoplanes sp. NPDC049596]|uniref:SAM-dependent methyltransferase n=1 Tax=unclassified Actinoplanes TaxID=2626549 RepID=UPI00342028B5
METDKIQQWSAAAQSLAVLDAAYERGWIAFLTEPRDVTALADFAGLPVDRVRVVVAVLTEIGVAASTGDEVRLTAAYAAMMAPGAPFSMADRLADARMMRRLAGQAVAGPLPAPDAQDALVVADAFGLRPTPVAAEVFRSLLAALPEFTEVLAGGRYLDVGCGVAGFLLSCASMYPTMHGVGVEVVATVAAEAQRRAEDIGVADRVEIRCMDARAMADTAAFGCAFWAQPFFPEAVRADTLAAIRRALEPGAPLVMQEMERPPDDPDERIAFALRGLVFSGWDVPFARSAEDLAAEAVEVGFRLDRIGESPLGRLVIVRKPA